MSLALVFSPQGSQVVGMGRDLAESSPAARATFDAADAALGWSVSETCWSGPQERLDDTRQTQPCLLTTSVAALRAMEEQARVAPAVVAGHSVGEYAALVAAGVLELDAALRLVSRRAELMAAVDVEGGMSAVIGLDRDAVEAIVDSVGRPTELVVANDNAPGQVVISGLSGPLDAAEALLRERGARRVIRLPVSGPFHSPLMASVAERLSEAFENEAWSDARIPVMSNVIAEPVTEAGRIRALLAEQVRSPVEWTACVRRMADDGVDLAVECGAGNALVGMIRRIAPGTRAVAVEDRAGLDAAMALLAGEGAGAVAGARR
jgi:[acyl-carrier-protein] S-malonyltransferase